MRREALLSAAAMALIACGGDSPDVDPSVDITPLAVGAPQLERADGGSAALPEGPVLLHFWATWCAPCRRELPQLLAAARELGIDDRVVAVTDEDWGPVRVFFSGGVPGTVVRDGGAAARLLGVSSLPDTYVVDRHGRATRRISGALDWSRPEHRAWLATTLAPPDEPTIREDPR